MKIWHRNIEYTIYWKYVRCPFCLHNGVNRNFKHECSDTTSCVIENLEKGIQISRSTLRLPPDIYNKEFGRKLAFKRVVEILLPNARDRASRKFFWQCYFELTNQLEKRDTNILLSRMNNSFAEIL